MESLGATTGYGAAWDLASGMGVLRARASRFGAALGDASEISSIDVAAVMVGVDAWMYALNARELESPARFGSAAVAALARLLTRAAGNALADHPVDPADATDRALARASAYARWVTHLGLPVTAVLQRAASDLAFGEGERRLAEMAWALQVHAEETV